MKIFDFFLIFILTLHTHDTKADVFRILDLEKDALQCRIDMTERATTELLISTYIIKKDDIGLGMLKLLIETAARGVKVRVILDSFGNELPPSLLFFLAEKGVEVRIFNRARLFEIHTFMDRMHGKVLIADIEHMIVGGRNLTEEYFELDPIGNFLDREVYTNNKKVAADVRKHFYAMWNNKRLTSIKVRKYPNDRNNAYWQKQIDDAWVSLQKRTNLTQNSTTDWANAPATTEVHATYDNFLRKKDGKVEVSDKKDRRGTRQLIALIDSAKHTIDIENPYFHATPRWDRAFKRATQRGVKIRLLTNSECTNDVLIMQAVYRRARPHYLKMGIQIWEYEGNKRLHTKAFVVDTLTVLIGSYNIHALSEKNNTEVCLWVKDTTIAAQNLHIMNLNLLSAKYIQPNTINLSNQYFEDNAQCLPKGKITNLFMRTLAPLLSWVM